MRKSLVKCYNFGRMASRAEKYIAPGFDPHMREMIFEPRTVASSQTLHENMDAWYFGYLSETAALEKPMYIGMFINACGAICKDADEAALSQWAILNEVEPQRVVDFAETMVAYEAQAKAQAQASSGLDTGMEMR